MKKNNQFIVFAGIIAALSFGPRSFAQWQNNGSHIYSTNSGNVGIGISNPSAKLQVEGGETQLNRSWLHIYNRQEDNMDAHLRFHIGGMQWYSMGIDHSDGGKFKINKGSDIDGGAFVLTKDGLVGIGTANPTARLSVGGVIQSTAGGIKFPDGSIQTTAVVQADTSWNSSGNSVYYGGNVGVGTTNPLRKLHVEGSALLNGRHLFLGENELYTDNDAHIHYRGNNSLKTGMVFYDKEGTRYGYIYGDDTGSKFGLLDSDGSWSYMAAKGNYTSFRIGGQEKMRILNSGYVGVGTSDPSSMLTVTGTIESTTGGVKFPDGTVQTTASSAVWSSANNEAYYNGNVGVGVTNPAARLHVDGGETRLNRSLLHIYSQRADSMDAHLRFHIGGLQHYSMGIDHSDTGKFKITPGL